MGIASDNPGRRLAAIVTVAALLCSWLVAPASAQRLRGADELEELSGVDVVERLGEPLPLDIEFVNAEGETQPLARYINGSRPTIIVMVYFDCPMICPVVLDKLHAALNELDYVAGRDFSVLVVSFDPTDTTTHASDRKLFYLSGYTHGSTPDISSGWQFMTGRPASIRALKDALGFEIRLLENGEYSHPVALAVTTPDGTVARYIYGLDYDPDQIMLSLLEASNGKIAKSLGEQFIFRCFRYNESEGRYTLHAMTLMRLGGGLTVVLLVVLIGGLFLKNRVRSFRSSDSTASNPTSSRGHTPAHTGSHA